MATAQGVLIESNIELQRVKKLGRNLVSDKRRVETKIRYQQAYAKVKTYGLSTKQLDTLLKSIVSHGAFFIQSELTKSSFSIHNH
jgi:cobalt-zinc-cadmium efflux system membrane fusion protein